MANITDTFNPEQWAQIVIERWEEKITQMNIGYTGDLINSFTHQINSDSSGNPELITFIMEYYGRMVDMGVGRGQPIGWSGRRKPKPWYSKTLARELHRLAGILARVYGRKAVTVITEGVEGNVLERRQVHGSTKRKHF